MVRPYIREFRPVLVAVDGGADALREAGLPPDVIVGDFDSVSDAALLRRGRARRPRLSGRERAGRERLRRLGLAFHTVVGAGNQRGPRAPARVREGSER